MSKDLEENLKCCSIFWKVYSHFGVKTLFLIGWFVGKHHLFELLAALTWFLLCYWYHWWELVLRTVNWISDVYWNEGQYLFTILHSCYFVPMLCWKLNVPWLACNWKRRESWYPVDFLTQDHSVWWDFALPPITCHKAISVLGTDPESQNNKKVVLFH